MVTPTLEDLATRLKGIERENRTLRFLSGTLVVIGIGLFAQAHVQKRSTGRTVEAERLVIRDKEGRIRAEFGVDRRGLPGLHLFDPRGREGATLEIASDDVSALTLSERGETRVSIEAAGSGSGAVRLFDRGQKSVTSLFMWPDGSTGLSAFRGREGVTMGVRSDGAGALVATDRDGREIDRVGNNQVEPAEIGLNYGPKLSHDRPVASKDLASPLPPCERGTAGLEWNPGRARSGMLD